MRILDIGCGIAKVDGGIGVDLVPLEGVDVIADMAAIPYPFADNSFDKIYLNDVIEHLPNTISAMEEVYRIARPDAQIFIRAVNWNSHYTAMDPTHLKAFTENSFDFFGKRKGRSYYTKARFNVVKVDHQYNALAERHFRSKRLLKFLSFYLCNILEGLNFELRAVKDNNANINYSLDDSGNIFDILRCPKCVVSRFRKLGDDPGRLGLFKKCWLVCQEEDCGGKYPVYDGLPVMLLKEANKWTNASKEDLPSPPPGDIHRITVEI